MSIRLHFIWGVLASAVTFGQAPSITSFSPDIGPIGTAVTITGSGFNSTASQNIVFFGATRASVISASATSLTVTVPTGATNEYFWVTNLAVNLTAYTVKPFRITLAGNILYSNHQDLAITTSNPTSVGIGDFDGDGKADLVSVNSGGVSPDPNRGASLDIFRNTSVAGTISFEKTVATGLSNPFAIAVGDLDGDGLPDLEISELGGAIRYYLNTSTLGAISFSAYNGLSDSGCFSLAIGDLDSDGKPDYAGSFSGSGIGVYRNISTPGSILFGPVMKVVPISGNSIRSVNIGDLDGDGKPDLVAGNNSANLMHVYLNTSTSGSITFAPKVDFSLPANSFVRIISIDDLDGDGKPDLAVPNFTTNNVSVFRNTSSTGALSLAARVDFPAGAAARFLKEADIDGDGKLDLLVPNYTANTISVIRNTSSPGTLSFDTPVAFATGNGPYQVTVGDLDGDNKPDLVTPNYFANTISVFRQLTPVVVSSFSPAGGCAGSASVVVTGSGFSRASRVTIGGTDVLNFTVDSPTQVTANVGSGTSGTIAVTADYTATSAGTFTFNYAPAQPGVISGNALLCNGTSTTYSVAAVTGSTSYTWVLPSGWTGTSTTNSINITASSITGDVSVTANNDCGSSPSEALTVTVNSIPAQAAGISGDASLCANDSRTYSVASVPGATSYTWTLPSGWTGTSTTNSIDVNANATSGDISVTADNTCGSSAAQTLAINVNSIPARPDAIVGDAGICAGNSKTYSIAPVNGAETYTWALPEAWTGTSTTNSIDIDASAVSGDVSVTADNTCGSSAAQALAISVNSIPAQPDAIVGDAVICAGNSKTYSIAPVNGATTYTWTLPEAWTGTSTTNSIDIDASAMGGDVSVTADNTCGSSAAQALAINVNSIPAQPDAIVGDAVICSGNSKTYSIAHVNGATTYTWTLPEAWTGTSTTNSIDIDASAVSGEVSVTADNTCGSSAAQTLATNVNSIPSQPDAIVGDLAICAGNSRTYTIASVSGATSYSWTLPSGWAGTSTTNSVDIDASATGGDVSVTANNACGSSSAQALAVTVNSIPGQPPPITGDVLVCAGNSATYSTGAVAGTTNYTWALPNGWTGTSSTNSIDIAASAVSGDVSVSAGNSCGSSSAQTLQVAVTNIPAQPATIDGKDVLCAGNSETYSIDAVNGATSYTWTLPDTWTGHSSMNTIDITTSAVGGSVSVTADNLCGSSPAQVLVVTAVSVPRPAITMNESADGYLLQSSSNVGNQWFLDGQTIAGATNNEYFTTSAGNYQIQVGSGDCLSELSVPVVLTEKIQIAFLPNLFSPNRNGMNDVFRVRGHGIKQIQFTIYDVSGKEVYSTADVAEATETGWDGKFKGADLPAGIYLWTLKGSYVNGEPLTNSANKYGQVMLLR